MADSLLKALFSNFVSTSGGVAAHSYDTLPDDDQTTLTAGAAADTFGSYAEVAATVGTSDMWLCGVYLTSLSAATDAKVEVATGASGSETPRVVVPLERVQVTAVGTYSGDMVPLPYPVRVPAGTRVAARMKTGSASADTADLVVWYATGLAG